MEIIYLISLLAIAIGLIVIATSKYHIHPFIALLTAAYLMAFGVAIPQSFGWLLVEGKIIDWLGIEAMIRNGFGGLINYIGIVIVLGCVIGTILEKSGAAIKIADTILRTVGSKRPALALSIIGWIVSIPVFCDSGYVILSALRKYVTKKTKASAVTMSVALATGLYASHTLVPPTPGPIAAAGNLGLSNQLGTVILVGLGVSIVTMLAGYFWAVWIGKKITIPEDLENQAEAENPKSNSISAYAESIGRELPSTFLSFAPIILPIILITLGSVAAFPNSIFTGALAQCFLFIGKPLNALFISFFVSCALLPAFNRETLGNWIGEGIKTAGSIILITAAGGALGTVIKSTPIAGALSELLGSMSLGLLVPFILAAALKTAQGSSTTALVTTSAIVAPLLATLGLSSTMGAVLTVMSIGAGAMTVSHANDSYFWIVTQFTNIEVKTAYKSFTVATLIQGLVTFALVVLLSFFLI